MIHGPATENYRIIKKVTGYTFMCDTKTNQKKEYTPGEKKKGDTNGVERVYKHPTHTYYARLQQKERKKNCAHVKERSTIHRKKRVEGREACYFTVLYVVTKVATVRFEKDNKVTDHQH